MEDSGLHGRIILKLILEKRDGRNGVDRTGLGKGHVTYTRK
jgi:hypothetical protein